VPLSAAAENSRCALHHLVSSLHDGLLVVERAGSPTQEELAKGGGKLLCIARHSRTLMTAIRRMRRSSRSAAKAVTTPR